MPVSCSPSDLVSNASQFCCITGSNTQAVKLYLLRHIAGLDAMTPQELLSASACFISCTPENAYKAVESYLLCQIANGGSGPCPECLLETVPAGNEQLFGIFTFGDIPGVAELIWNGTTTDTGFDIESPSLVSFSAPNLVSIDPANTQGGFITLAGASLLSVSAPLLQTCQGIITLQFNPVLNSIDLSSLVAAPKITVLNDPMLTILNLPALVTCFDLAGSGCTVLSSVLVTNFVPQNGGTFFFSGCAFTAASVELILRRAVLAAVTTYSILIDAGTGTGLASLSAQGQADYAALVLAGNSVTLNP